MTVAGLSENTIVVPDSAILTHSLTDQGESFWQQEALTQSLVVSIKEVYGWLLIIAILSFIGIILYRGKLRPFAIFPKWRTIRKMLCKTVKSTELP